MPGYALDTLTQTNPLGTDVSNALDKQPTGTGFVNLPQPPGMVQYPGGLYVPDPSAIPAYVQGNAFSGGGTPVATQALAFGANVTAGDLIVVAVGWTQSGGPSTCTITDSQGNTYSTAQSFPSAGPFLLSNIGYLIQVWWTLAGSTGPCTVTFTAGSSGTPTAPFCRFLIHDYANTTATVDASQSQVINAPTNPMTNTVTTTTANDLLFAWTVDNAGDTGYVSPAVTRQTAGSEQTGDVACPVVGSNSISVTEGQQGGGMLAVAFKPAAGSGPVTTGGSGAIVFAGAGTATVTVAGTGSGAITFAGSGVAASVGPVTGTGAIVFAGTGLAKVTLIGAGAGAITFGGSGTGTVTVGGTGSGAITFAGSGTATVSGLVTTGGTGAITFAGAGLATVRVNGAGSGAMTFAGSGTATYQVGVTATGTGAMTFAGSGTAVAGLRDLPPATATVILTAHQRATVHLVARSAVTVRRRAHAGVVVYRVPGTA